MDELPRSRNLRFTLIAGILFLFMLAACLPEQGGAPEITPRSNPWAKSLRALDPADAPAPADDITAVYLRPDADDKSPWMFRLETLLRPKRFRSISISPLKATLRASPSIPCLLPLS